MFQFETLHNTIGDKLISEESSSGFVNVLPLDDIPVGLPKDWQFKPTCMPKQFTHLAEEFANFEIREDDVWIVTFPKCGTTWAQQMTWMLLNNLDYEKANTVDITDRSIFLEFSRLLGLKTLDTVKAIREQSSPRVIKTHLPISLLPRDIWRKKCKVIYVARNPKDVIVSYCHHFVKMVGYRGTVEEFAEGFVTDELWYCSFWNHVLEFWMIRDVENMIFLTFEDMKKDLKAVVNRTCDFLGKSYTHKEIDELVYHLSFNKMKDSPTCNNQSLVKSLYEVKQKEYNEGTAFGFMRKGEVGAYKEELPQIYIDRINKKTKKMFHPHGLDLYCTDD